MTAPCCRNGCIHAGRVNYAVFSFMYTPIGHCAGTRPTTHTPGYTWSRETAPGAYLIWREMEDTQHFIFLGQEFCDFAAFNEAIKKEEEKTFVKCVIQTSKRVTTKNKNLQPGQPKYHEKFHYSSITLGCKHAGDVRKRGNSSWTKVGL